MLETAMLSVSLIERTLETRDHDRLLRGLADNGMALPLALRMRLAEGVTAPTALALRRLVELTYGPTALSRQLVDRLLDQQQPDGSFSGGTREPGGTGGTGGGGQACGVDVLATATALAALSRVVREHPASATPALRAALARGFVALAGLQDCDGLFTASADRSLADRAMTTAFIMSLLASDQNFRGTVRVFEAYRWFEQRDGQLDRHTQHLWDLASVSIHDVVVSAMLAA